MAQVGLNYKALCTKFLQAESEDEVSHILADAGLLDPKHWKALGNMPNNLSVVNNQQQDAGGALVEKIINSLDAMLIKECLLAGIPPEAPVAPQTMSKAAEKFFHVKDGNLANLNSTELTALAENVQIVTTGTKAEPCYLIIDTGEGQVPSRFEETFLALTKTNKARIRFVQGKFNCGGTGVLPFCGTRAYELIISRRCPQLPSGPDMSAPKDSSHDLWGFTLIRRLPASAGIYNTATYVYLAPIAQIPSFPAEEIPALPEVVKDAPVELPEDALENDGEQKGRKPPRPYLKGLSSGTVIKLYNYKWKGHSLATRDARSKLEEYLYRPCLPVRIVETRGDYHANTYATTLAGTAVTIAKDQEKGYLEDNFPATGQLHPTGVGLLPISIVVYKEKTGDDGKRAKATKSLVRGLYFIINGQVHYQRGPEFFSTRGLPYGYLQDTLFVVADCTSLPDDIRDQLIMPSRDRLRGIREFDAMLEAVVEDLKDRDILRIINDQRRLRRVKESLTQEAFQGVLQALVTKDPVFAALFKGGRGLRNPHDPGPMVPEPAYKGKLPPTYFCFENNKPTITKSFPIDRTCTVELLTDAVNGYFHLPNPADRGSLNINPDCFERWHLQNGRLRIVFRAPVNARIGDNLDVEIIVTDPTRATLGKAPWTNTVTLKFAEGGKEVRSGTKARSRKQVAEIGAPQPIEVLKERWSEFNFDEKSALKVVKNGDGYDFYVNMDNRYLLNELMHRKGSDQESAKFAYKWGLVLVALGMLQELKNRDGKSEDVNQENGESSNGPTAEEHISRFSAGVAAVIVPTVLDLLGTMKAEKQPAAVSG
jgi:hypothetical protein